MPNLISFFNTEEYYHPDLKIYYEFNECEINSPYYKLLHFEGSEKNGKEMHLYLLTDKEDNDLAILKLSTVTYGNKSYYQINKSFSLIPQKGYGLTIYNFCFQFHNGDILSDHINTLPGSFNLWKKLLKNEKISAKRLDTKNNKKLNLNINKEFLIWGISEDYLEAINETPWQAVIFEKEYENTEYIGDESEDDFFVDYLSMNDKIERTILSDYIVKALKNNKKIKDRHNILILIEKK
ncbi:hypothetical protein [Flavobacterium sp. NRK F7]|uniref:hypothetical protein n=1 Tax=Flavobacterium sp. NRK F7 TaxID=2954930 RepID=UPI00209090CF|nr:hypothetical protein [Flavobacterium sp. NRK F7]MCO6164498.1 hypothetical protein [Flavobacterium sp. NRK F7]